MINWLAAHSFKIFTPWKLLLIVSVLVIACVIYYTVKNVKTKTFDWPKRKLVKMDPLVLNPNSAVGGVSTSKSNNVKTLAVNKTRKDGFVRVGKDDIVLNDVSIENYTEALTNNGNLNKTTLFQYRPYNEEAPEDYYGAFNITVSKSVTLILDSTPEYYEVVVYSFPDWKIMYSETNTPVIPMDFLPVGTYAVIIFTVDDSIPTNGYLEICRNTNREKPRSKAHRQITKELNSERIKSIERTVKSLSPKDSNECISISSSPCFVWPGTVFTRIETISNIPVPEDTLSIFAVFPSYGYVVNGSEDYDMDVVHEGNSYAIYKIGKRVKTFSDDDDETESFETFPNNINFSIVYPDTEPLSQVVISPPSEVYFYI